MVEMILISSVLLLLFICLRKILDGRIPAGLQYGLWLFVAVRLLLMWVPLPGSSVSVMNLVPVQQDSFHALQEEQAGAGTEILDENTEASKNSEETLSQNDSSVASQKDGGLPQEDAASQGNGSLVQEGASSQKDDESAQGDSTSQDVTLQQEGADVQTEQKELGNRLPARTESERKAFLLHSLITWIYGLGVCVMLLWMTVKNLRLWIGIRRRRMLYEGELPVAALPGKLYMVEHLDVPFLFGRNIYISPEMFSDQQKLRHILVHETCHWKQGDHVWSVLRCLCMALYWYHPLVWYGAHLSIIDAEMACDARAIRIMGEESRHGYGETLLDLIRNQSGLLECIGMSTQMSGNKKETKVRLERIVEQRKRSRGRILFLAASMVVLCLITLPENGERENLAKDARWERVKQEGFPCILLDEEGNVTGTIRGELLERVVFDYVNVNMELESYQIKAGAFSDCRNLKTLVLPWQGESYEPYGINYIDENAFQGCPEDMVVYCKENSYAWNRLKELGITVREAGVDEDEEWRSSVEDANALKKIQKKIDSEGNDSLLTDREMRQFYGEPFYMMTESGKIVPRVCNSLGEWAGDRQIYLPEEADSIDGTFANYFMTDTSITIPKNMTEIGDMTFMCAEFSEIIFEEGSKLRSIGSHAFEQRTNITELQLPEGLYNIGEAAFWYCPALKELTIPESVQTVGNSCFSACTALERVTVLNPDITFGEDAFPFEIINPELSDDEIDIKNPDANYIPNDQLVIVCHKGSNAEKYAQEHGARVEYLKEEQETAENSGKSARWERVEQEGFPCIVVDGEGNITGTRRGELLNKVILNYLASEDNQNIKFHNWQIRADAFSDCSNLRTLVLPEQDAKMYASVIDYIDENAFRGCSKDLVVYTEKETYAWTRLNELGVTVKEISANSEWESLGTDPVALQNYERNANGENDIELTRQEKQQIHGEPFFMMTESGQVLRYLCEALSMYIYAVEPKIYLPADAHTLAGTFAQYDLSKSPIRIPKDMVVVGDASFLGCQVSEISFEAGSRLQTIGDYAFTQCEFSEIQLPEGVLEIGSHAFSVNKKLKEITIPASVRFLGVECFQGCDSLKRVVILNPNITMEENIFDDEILNPKLSDDEIDLDDINSNYIHNNQLTIVCHEGSNAEKYALTHDLQVEYLE